jgi:hypothetical protein
LECPIDAAVPGSIDRFKLERISKKWIRVQGKARDGEKAESRRRRDEHLFLATPQHSHEHLDAFLRWIL